MTLISSFLRRNLSFVIALLVLSLCLTLLVIGPINIRARAQKPAPQEGKGTLAPASATSTETWTGGDSNDFNWTSNGNWSGIGEAGPEADLVFSVGAAPT